MQLLKHPFLPLKIHDRQDAPICVTRAEEEDDLLRIPSLERAHLFEKRRGDAGYVYNDNEVIKLNSSGEFFLVWNQGELIGYTSLIVGGGNDKIGVKKDDAYYAGSLLKPEWRRKGISKGLNQVRENRAHLYECQRAISCLVANNRSSIAALTKAGFIISNAVREVFPPNEAVSGDRLIMTKNLHQESPKEIENTEEENITLKEAQETFERIWELIQKQRIIIAQKISSDGKILTIYHA